VNEMFLGDLRHLWIEMIPLYTTIDDGGCGELVSFILVIIEN